MIRNSFIFLEKIGRKGEENLWKQGIADWHAFLNAARIRGISPSRRHYYRRKIEEAQKALHDENAAHFAGILPSAETWRLYPEFKEQCGYLDIEIDAYGRITVVGISSYFESAFFVRGANLSRETVQKELQKYKLLATFNGAAFDLPRLKKHFGIDVRVPHIDLRHCCARAGLSGGLKEIEKKLNLKRPPHLYGNPVELWQAFHASGDREWLDLLLEYNREDIENLKGIIEWVYKKLAGEMEKALG